MYNYRLQLQYDGGRYDGWVRMGKDSNSNTIECKIKEIIQKMTGEDIDIYVGCRTETVSYTHLTLPTTERV